MSSGGGDLVRVSDADRDRAVASLRDHLVEGRLSLEEFTQRMDAAYLATTSADLAALEADLPAKTQAALPDRRRAVGFTLAIFGGAKRAGSFRVREKIVSLTLFGGTTLDLRGATLEGDVVTIHSLTMFGGFDVIVPEGVEVDLTGLAIFGAKEMKGTTSGVVRPGAPLVRVNAFVLFGGASVRVRKEK
jgi:uncharacterized protein DUF1707